MASGRKRKAIAQTDNQLREESNVCSNSANLSIENRAAVILRAVQKSREVFGKSVRKSLQNLRKELEFTRKNGQDPASIFPQEIWEIIFRFVDDVQDLANCGKVCTLFKSVIDSNPQELLFGKVIPFVFPYFGKHTNMETLVACGRVCKKWRGGVDSFADHYFRVRKFPLDNLDKLKKEPTKYFEDKELLKKPGFYEFLPVSLEEEQEMIERGDIEVVEGPENHPDADDMHQRYRRNLRNKRMQLKIEEFPFLTSTSKFPTDTPSELASLKLHGPLLWKVNLDVETYRSEKFNLHKFFTFLVKVLEACPNMRELGLSNYEELNLKVGKQEQKILQQFNLPLHPKLESFEVDSENAVILPLQIAILQSLCATLEHVKVRNLDKKMAYFKWNSLTYLEILEGNSDQVLKSLEPMEAPKLHKLYVRLDSTSLNLSQFFKTINRFPTLRQLTIFLTGAFNNVCTQKLIGVRLEVSENRIAVLEVISEKLDAAQDFPLLFPMVRKLTIRYGEEIDYTISSSDDDDDGHAQDDALEQNGLPIKIERYIQIHKTKKKMYQSSIWSLLPRLELLKLQDKEDADEIVREFTRYGKNRSDISASKVKSSGITTPCPKTLRQLRIRN